MSRIEDVVKKQRAFFGKKQTFNVNYRIKYLKRLKQVILECEEEICQALKLDLGKSSACFAIFGISFSSIPSI